MKNQQTLKTQTGFYLQLKLDNIKKLKSKIKKNEGFRNTAYKDQLGNLTIGYGHLLKKEDKIKINKKYSKKYLLFLFDKDFNQALTDFKKKYSRFKLSKKTKHVIIEMIFQLGIKKTLQFKKFNKHLRRKEIHMASLEMLNSLWYEQTPNRVNNHIKNFLK